jgi:hypothetical protein
MPILQSCFWQTIIPDYTVVVVVELVELVLEVVELVVV